MLSYDLKPSCASIETQYQNVARGSDQGTGVENQTITVSVELVLLTYRQPKLGWLKDD